MRTAYLLQSLFAVAVVVAGRRRDNRHSYINSYGPIHLYPHPAYLPIMPYYRIDVPDEQRQEAKFFGVMAPTRYETIIVRETVRPVCLLVDGNVPSCDHLAHHHQNHYDNNNYDRSKMPTANGGGRRPTVADYESYFVEPSKPDVQIEMTEIPFRGTFLLTGATTDERDDHRYEPEGQNETPPLAMAVRPVTEDVHEKRAAVDQRQFLQNTLNAAGAAIAGSVGGAVVNLGSGVAGVVANLGGGGGGGGGVALGAGGGRQPVTVYVTRVERVVDDYVTATLVPKNCMPSGVRLAGLRPCDAHPYANVPPPTYRPQQHPRPQQPPEQPFPTTSVEMVSKANVLVQDFVNAQTSSDGHGGVRYDA
ncbi:Hypothetical protein CINCED_3A024349 [Cinara cedri]|uniref:Uncharacterized protein n=1 Tax=Cinara cedri TaxID=506608 RepID=A0A5E4MEU6_9HEMI|nr:Hypothetical protein CINCED_3A024349 [Cinara cedri]